MAVAATRCNRCERNVPSENFALHEARCPGSAARASSSPAVARRDATGGPTLPVASSPAASSPAASLQGEGPTPAQLAQALTWARTKPGEVLAALRRRLEHYKGKDYFPPDRQGRCIVTKEGTQAVNDAIAFVQALAPMGGVGSGSEQGLALAAEDHVADIGRTGTAAHSSSDGTSAAQRVQRYGSFTSFGECLWYGSASADAQTIILDLIVDDGVPSRGHRKGIYNPVYNTVGAAYGTHATFGKMAALEFAQGWQPSDMFIRARLQSGPFKMGQQAVAKAKASAQTQWSLGICPICNEQIKGGRVVEVAQLGGKLHSDCFQCSACSKPLAGGTYKVQAKKPFCTDCWVQRFAERCVSCGEPIAGTLARCALGTYHPECLVCSTCNKAIGKAPFSTDGGVLTCSACSAGADDRKKVRTRAGSLTAATGSSLATAGGSIAGSSSSHAAKASSSSSAAGSSFTAAKAKPRAKSPVARAPAAAKSPAAAGDSMVKAKPAPKPKVTLHKAVSTVNNLGMDYGGLG